MEILKQSNLEILQGKTIRTIKIKETDTEHEYLHIKFKGGSSVNFYAFYGFYVDNEGNYLCGDLDSFKGETIKNIKSCNGQVSECDFGDYIEFDTYDRLSFYIACDELDTIVYDDTPKPIPFHEPNDNSRWIRDIEIQAESKYFEGKKISNINHDRIRVKVEFENDNSCLYVGSKENTIETIFNDFEKLKGLTIKEIKDIQCYDVDHCHISFTEGSSIEGSYFISSHKLNHIRIADYVDYDKMERLIGKSIRNIEVEIDITVNSLKIYFEDGSYLLLNLGALYLGLSNNS